MASHKKVIHTDFLACHGREVHRVHRRAFPAEMLRQPLQRLTDPREANDIAIKNEAYLTAVQGDIVPVGQQRCPAQGSLSLEIPYPQQAESHSTMAGERISFFLTFCYPQRHGAIGEERLTARRAIKAHAGPFREQVFSGSTFGVWLWLI